MILEHTLLLLYVNLDIMICLQYVSIIGNNKFLIYTSSLICVGNAIYIDWNSFSRLYFVVTKIILSKQVSDYIVVVRSRLLVDQEATIVKEHWSKVKPKLIVKTMQQHLFSSVHVWRTWQPSSTNWLKFHTKFNHTI